MPGFFSLSDEIERLLSAELETPTPPAFAPPRRDAIPPPAPSRPTGAGRIGSGTFESSPELDWEGVEFEDIAVEDIAVEESDIVEENRLSTGRPGEDASPTQPFKMEALIEAEQAEASGQTQPPPPLPPPSGLLPRERP